MLTRSVRLRLTVFAAVSVLVLAVTAVRYVRLPELFGFGQFQVHADFSDASGLYTNGNVTYRGTSVGHIGNIRAGRDGVVVTLDIDNGSRIPVDSVASIHSTSAIGEQYIDLVPTSAAGDVPDLHDGSTIVRADTRELPSTSAVIDSLDRLFASVPQGAANRTLTDLATAFNQAGPDVQRLLNSATALLSSAQANFPQTQQLLRSLSPFLATQHDLADQTTSTVSNLTTFTHQLVLSNTQIVDLIRETPALARQVTGTEQDLTPSLNLLLANLTTVGQVLQVYDPAVRQILTIYPALVSGLIDFAQGTAATGRIPLYFHLNLNDPPNCTTGFIPVSQRRDPSDTTSIETPKGLYCKQAPSSPSSVRGARNLPCLNNPGVRAATPAACLGLPEPTGDSDIALVRSRNGTATAPDGRSYRVTESEPAVPNQPGSWKQFLLGPIGK